MPQIFTNESAIANMSSADRRSERSTRIADLDTYIQVDFANLQGYGNRGEDRQLAELNFALLRKRYGGLFNGTIASAMSLKSLESAAYDAGL